jgi:mannose-1-phosphate guanylyltransferase
MSHTVIPLILSGGSGSRLWPLSNKNSPKQFIPLTGEQSLLQETLTRLNGINTLAPPIVVCNKAHQMLVTEQLKRIGINNATIILEPCGRNTAPAVAAAAMQALTAHPGVSLRDTKCRSNLNLETFEIHKLQHAQDPILLVLPSDHAIKDHNNLHQAIAAAIHYAENDFLVTFGIKPTRPETGYGYIQAASERITKEKDGYKIERFVEKPDLATAKEYLAAQNYYWNSGMFVFKASTFLRELQNLAPQVFESCKQAVDCMLNEGACVPGENEVWTLPQDKFSKCQNISIDYAVMEKTAHAAVIPLNAGWSDVGTWSSLWEYGDKDLSGNVIIGDVVANEIKNSYIHATTKKVVAIGIDDCIIVETDKAVLVMPKSKCQDIKSVVEKL